MKKHSCSNIIDVLNKRIRELSEENIDLKLNERKYYSILSSMSEPIEIDDSNLNITYVNKAFCEFYGMSEEELLHTNTMNWIVSEDRDRIGKMMDRLTPDNPNYHYKCRVTNTNQDIFWIEVYGHVFYDDDGNVLEYLDISRDISSYKSAAKSAEWFRVQTEEKIRERTLELINTNIKLSAVNSYLQTTLNHISEGIIILEINSEPVLMNYGINTGWGMNEETLKTTLEKYMYQDSSSPIYRLMHSGTNFVDKEIVFPAATGESQYLVSGTYINNNSSKQGLLVCKPLSEMKQFVNKFNGAQAKYHFSDILGESLIMKEIIAFAERIAAGDGNIMIEGESGTGKELFAQSIHNASSRRNGPFIAVNCGAIPRDLIASELFGYTEGSFTGAKRGGKPGKFEMASGGTIFLDEIGDMPLEQQITLLRIIQERTVNRIGGTKEIPINVRIICATHKNLQKEVARENFRQDLYFRLNVINIHIPPLRERKEDIPVLFNHFLQAVSKRDTKEVKTSKEFSNMLLRYAWPGNVRELQNIIERAYFVSASHYFTIEHLPKYICAATETTSHEEQPFQSSFTKPQEKEASLHIENEKEYILSLLAQYGHNASRVAKEMRISRTTLYRKFAKYNISKETKNIN